VGILMSNESHSSYGNSGNGVGEEEENGELECTFSFDFLELFFNWVFGVCSG
jgi:hypothetical protein